MPISADGKNWAVLGKLASTYFVRDLETMTAAFKAADLIVAAEEMRSEHLAQIIARPAEARKGFIARLFSSTPRFTPPDVLAALTHWAAERSAPDAPELARPLIIFAPSFERQCLKALKLANIRALWTVAGFSYHQVNSYSTMVSDLQRVIGRAPDVSTNSPMSVGFRALESICCVCGLDKSVLSLQNNSIELYKLYPELCKTIDPATVDEPL